MYLEVTQRISLLTTSIVFLHYFCRENPLCFVVNDVKFYYFAYLHSSIAAKTKIFVIYPGLGGFYGGPRAKSDNVLH